MDASSQVPGACPGALQPLPGVWSGVLRAGELSGRQTQMKEPRIPAADPWEPTCSNWDVLPQEDPCGLEPQTGPLPLLNCSGW